MLDSYLAPHRILCHDLEGLSGTVLIVFLEVHLFLSDHTALMLCLSPCCALCLYAGPLALWNNSFLC